MTYEAVSDDVQFDAPVKPEPTAVASRRDIAQVESTLTEFDKLTAGLDELRERFPADLVYDVTTTKGMTEARAHRAAWRDPRITVEKFRKAGKAPVLALGKNIDARAAWLTEQLLIGEKPVDDQIKVEEARQAQIKADKEAAEFGRIMAMQEAVGEIAMLAMVAGLPPIAIAARLESLRSNVLDPKIYQEMMPQAEAARTAAIAKMEQGLKAAQWDEAEAKRKADEAERQRAEQAAADAERARISAAQVEESKRLQEARDMIAKAEREAAEQIAAERAAFERERMAFKAAQAVAAAAAPMAVVTLTTLAAPPSTALVANTRPPITTGVLCEFLQFTVNAEFVKRIGITPAAAPAGAKNGTFWNVRDISAIKAAIVQHLESLPDAPIEATSREAMPA